MAFYALFEKPRGVQEAAKDIPPPLMNMKQRPRSESSPDNLDTEDERVYRHREKKHKDNSVSKDDDDIPGRGLTRWAGYN